MNEKCFDCLGRGWVLGWHLVGDSWRQVRPCSRCGGTGREAIVLEVRR